MPEAVHAALPYIVVVNAAVVAVVLVVAAIVIARGKLEEVPGPAQNAVERGMEWFIGLARGVRPDAVRLIAPFLAGLFVFIVCCNLLAVLPVPVLQIPPTSYYSVTAALAVVGTFGAILMGARLEGGAAALKHLFWPNPLQLVSEVSHVLSLSLRLFGNIGGEFLVAILVAAAVPYGMPLIIHLLGLVPAIVQPVVFTLLVSSFLSEAMHITSGRRTPTRTAPTLTAEVP